MSFPTGQAKPNRKPDNELQKKNTRHHFVIDEYSESAYTRASMKRAYSTLWDYLNGSGETQQAFAVKLGISQSYLSRICNGRLEPPLWLALKIARLANVPLESLVYQDNCQSGNCRV